MRRTAGFFKLLLALFLLGALAAPSFAAAPKNVSAAEARALLAREKKIVLLDVRTPEEYRQAHLKGAHLIPLGELERRLNEVPRDRPILVYCAVGSRSASAAGLLASRGYRDIYNMSDGIVGWYKSGFPIER